MHMEGRARDLFTPRDGAPPVVLAEDEVDALVTAARKIISIHSPRLGDRVARLAGCSAGGQLRSELGRLLPDELEQGTSLYLLLDDLAGASLVSTWAWSVWCKDWELPLRASGARATAGHKGRMEGVCAGFIAGSSALDAQGEIIYSQSRTPVQSIIEAVDPAGWHAVKAQSGIGMRRARRIDTWIDDVAHIDVGFQDSSTSPVGGRVAVHEYRVIATADAATFKLLSLVADPRILPYAECLAAPLHASRLLGTCLTELRSEVKNRLPGTLGCTHLNDVLRSMAEVPQMLAAAANHAAG
jgi:Protein of unknown function (DUF2889)